MGCYGLVYNQGKAVETEMHQPDEKHCNEKTFAKDEKAKKFDYSPALQVTSFHSCEGSFKHVNDCGKIP